MVNKDRVIGKLMDMYPDVSEKEVVDTVDGIIEWAEEEEAEITDDDVIYYFAQ